MRRVIASRAASMLLLPLLLAAASACRENPVTPPSSGGRDRSANAAAVVATAASSMYAPDLVATAAKGTALNDAGDVVGTSYRDIGCGSFCLPPQDQVVWRGSARIVLPGVPAFGSNRFPTFINSQGVVAGIVGVPGTNTHAAVWSPTGPGYGVQDIGTLSGMASADVAGIDDRGRVVGWSSTGGAIPTAAAPYVWSQSTGMQNLATLGFPNERPAAISPGGRVVTQGFWYRLGEPTSALPLPPLPRGFVGAGVNGSAINDAGDQAHFLVNIGPQNLVYPFRLPRGGSWQQISNSGTGHASRFTMGSINFAQDVTFTALSTGMLAPGSAGVGQPLTPLMSPAYPGATVSFAGPMNASGQILAEVLVGRSPRLVKLTPAAACGVNCIVVSSLVMTGQFVQDPAFPGSCFQGGKMFNLTSAALTVKGESGAPLAGAQVRGHFLDDYWTDSLASGTTDAAGRVTFTHRGLCGVGAIAFLVDGASLGTRTLDRTRGTLASYVIPSVTPPPPPPTNLPPVARWTYSCTAAHTCTFDGRASSDPDGSVVRWSWVSLGQVVATTPVFTRSFDRPATRVLTLTVTDDGDLTGSATQTVVIP